MSYGLSTELLASLRQLFGEFPAVEQVILYGSRAKGNFKPGSDIDLTLVGETISFDDFLAITGKLDDLMTPYQFDVSLYRSIVNQELIEHITRVGKVLYDARKGVQHVNSGIRR